MTYISLDPLKDLEELFSVRCLWGKKLQGANSQNCGCRYLDHLDHSNVDHLFDSRKFVANGTKICLFSC